MGYREHFSVQGHLGLFEKLYLKWFGTEETLAVEQLGLKFKTFWGQSVHFVSKNDL